MKEHVINITDGKSEYYFNSRDLHDLVFAKADGNYIDVFFVRTQYRNIRIQIGQFWKKIEALDIPHGLIRIDRSTIINLRRVVFVNPKQRTITLRSATDNVQLKIAQAAFSGLKDKVAQMIAKSSRGVLLVNRKEWKGQSATKSMHKGHAYVDLGLPSGTLWASKDMSMSDSDFALYSVPLYDSPLVDFGYNSSEDDVIFNFEIDRAEMEWGGGWRIPTAFEWKELLKECVPQWVINKDGNVACVLTGKNGNQIVLSSVSPHRGLCTYWTLTEVDNDKDSDNAEDYIPKFFSLEIIEPYEDEPWYHFVTDLDKPECNLHPVISAKNIR